MSTDTENALTAKQESFLAALLESPSIKAAARSLGISDRTAYRWFEKNPEFRTAYRDARRQIMDHVSGRLAAAGSDAVEVLLSIAKDEAAGGMTRVSAAGRLIDAILKLTELESLSGRLDDLEATLAPLRNGGGQ